MNAPFYKRGGEGGGKAGKGGVGGRAANRSTSKATAPAPKTGAATVSKTGSVLDAVKSVASQKPSGSLLRVAEVRAGSKLNKEAFDKQAMELSRAGKIVLTHHDAPFSVSESDRNKMVRDSRGNYYNGIALRSGS